MDETLLGGEGAVDPGDGASGERVEAYEAAAGAEVGDEHAKAEGGVPRTSAWRSAFLLMNAILGSGILGQAYALRHSGFLLYTFGLLVMAGVAYYGAWLLIKCCELVGVSSYEEVGQAALGVWGKRLAVAAILVQNVSAMTSYLVILGDSLPPLLPQGVWYSDRAVVMVAITLLVVLPLVCLRHVGALSLTSAASILIMVLFTGVSGGVVPLVGCPLPESRLPEGGQPSPDCSLRAVSLGLDTFYVIPSIAFSFVCHTALLPIYTELKRRSDMTRVTLVAMATCLVLYMTAGTLGYAAFRGSISSDALKSLAAALPALPAVTLVRVLVAVSVTLTVPLINYPARKAITLALCDGRPFSWRRHITIGVSVVLLILAVAILVPNVRNIFGAAGATSSVSLMAILPGLFFRTLFFDSHDALLRFHARSAAPCFAVLGGVLGVVSLGGIISSWVAGTA